MLLKFHTKFSDIYYHITRNQDSSVSIVTGYELDSWNSILSGGKRFFSTPQCPDRIWGPLSLLSNGYLGLFPQG
jgi:hypothetical protein